MEDQPMAMEAVLGLENPAPLDDMDTAAISDEPIEDAEESMIQEDEGSAPAMVEDMVIYLYINVRLWLLTAKM
jgi:hypothetical protein